MKTPLLATALLITTLFLISCDPDSSSTPEIITSGTATVHTVNYPLAYFAERIAGDRAEVIFAAPADGDPAFWKPDDTQLGAFQKADVILLNGANYAKWRKTTSLPSSKTVDTSAGFSDQYITVIESTTHSHGDGEAHAHTGTAFTTWLDFSLARQQAKAIADALSERIPDGAETFQANYVKLASDLDALDSAMQSAADKIGDQPLFASHPVYQYWARRYGINLVAVHWEPEVLPDTAALNELVKKSVDHDGKWMIWEGEPLDESVKKLEQRTIKSLVFDPCGNRPGAGDDWLLIMRQNIANLEAAFGQ